MLTTRTLTFAFVVLAFFMAKVQSFHSGRGLEPKLHGMNLYWLTCEKQNDQLSGKCKIFRKSLLDGNQTSFCNVELKGQLKDGIEMVPDVTHMQALFTNNAAIAWYNSGQKFADLKIRIIQFPDCNFVDTSIKLNFYSFSSEDFLRIVANNEGTFDAYVDNAYKCRVRLCKYSFDAQGTLLHKPTEFYDSGDRSLLQIADLESSNGTYIITDIPWGRIYYQERMETFIVNSKGQRFLKEYPSPSAYREYLTASTAYGTIRVCEFDPDKSNVTCTTYNTDGKPLLNTTVNVDHNVYHAEVKNLANGEFFLITRHSAENTLLTVTRIGDDNKPIGSFTLTEINCKPGSTKKSDFEVKSDTYCVSTLCYDDKPFTEDIESESQCFSNKDLKLSYSY